jgi:hypothetical protein
MRRTGEENVAIGDVRAELSEGGDVCHSFLIKSST